MKNITIFAIIVGIGSALIGSLVFQLTLPQSHTLEEQCLNIAREAFQIQNNYPNYHLNELPSDVRNTLEYLDTIWFRDCVSVFSEEQILDMAQIIRSEYYSDE